MAADALGGLLEALERQGDLIRVGVEVDPELEIAEITDRFAKAGGPALVFERVHGHTLPVVTNLLGTPARIRQALGAASFEELEARLSTLLTAQAPERWVERLRIAPGSSPWAVTAPKTVTSAVCQQVVSLGRDVDLGQLPVLRCWPQDSARSLTAATVFTQDPQSLARHVGLYSLSIVDPRRLAVAWEPYDGGALNFSEYQRRQNPMPMAIVLGGEPAQSLAAALPLPADWDRCLAVGWLLGRGLELVMGRTVELEVPAAAELVIEGFVDPAEPMVELGPLGSETGFYSPQRQVPVMQVTAVTRRANPVFPVIVAGRPPHELAVLRQTAARLIVPFVRRLIPEIIDVDLPVYSGGRRVAFVAIDKRYPGQARKVAAAMWGLGIAPGNRLLVVVDRDIDVRDPATVMFAVGANADMNRDVTIQGLPTDWLDQASCEVLAGHAMAIDATRKLPEEHPRGFPAETRMSDEMRTLVDERWASYGFEGAHGNQDE